MSVILCEVFCMLAGKILWHWWATTKPTTSYSISKYFTILCYAQYIISGAIFWLLKNYDLCCATGYDPRTNWIVNVLFTWLWCVYTAEPKAVVIFYSFKFFFVLLSWFVPLITWIFITFCFALRWSATVLNIF